MEGRNPNSIMMTLATCSDRAHFDEWLDWSSYIHTPDITSAGVFTYMTRFRNASNEHQGREIINLSESDFEDPLEALEELKRKRAPFRSDDRMSPYTKVVPGGGPFIKVGGEFQFVRNAPVHAIFISASQPMEEADEATYNKWYNDIYIPNFLKPGIFQSAYRYEMAAPDPHFESEKAVRKHYLCIYETEYENVIEAVAENQQSMEKSEEFNKSCEKVDTLWEIAASRIFPLEGRRSN